MFIKMINSNPAVKIDELAQAGSLMASIRILDSEERFSYMKMFLDSIVAK